MKETCTACLEAACLDFQTVPQSETEGPKHNRGTLRHIVGDIVLKDRRMSLVASAKVRVSLELMFTPCANKIFVSLVPFGMMTEFAPTIAVKRVAGVG